MFYRRPRIFPIIFVGFLAMMLLGGARSNRYENAYNQGFVAGQTAAVQTAPPAAAPAESAPSAAPVNPAPHYNPYQPQPRAGFGLFHFLFYLFFFSFIFRMLGRMSWAGYAAGARRHRGRHRFDRWDGRSAKERKHDRDNGPADDFNYYDM